MSGEWEKEVLGLMRKHLGDDEMKALTYEHGPYEITKVVSGMMTLASALVLSERTKAAEIAESMKEGEDWDFHPAIDRISQAIRKGGKE